MDDAITAPTRSAVAHVILALYGSLLAAIAFWPTPVDAGLGGLIAQLTSTLPALTYPRLEFGANILLFVPLGVLLALILPRARYLVAPLSLIVTVTVECVQAIALDQRTPSVMDIVANTTGACLGLLLVAVIAAARRPAPARTRTAEPAEIED